MNDPVAYAGAVALVAAGLAAWWQWRCDDGLHALIGFGFLLCLASSWPLYQAFPTDRSVGASFSKKLS